MQRLFSTFPCGLPGAGLLLLRGAVAFPLLHVSMTAFSGSSVITLVPASAGALLLVGLWTPVVGALLAVAQLGLAWSHWTEPWAYVHSGALSAALAMLGPGGCSVDARLFGRKTIHIPAR